MLFKQLGRFLKKMIFFAGMLYTIFKVVCRTYISLLKAKAFKVIIGGDPISPDLNVLATRSGFFYAQFLNFILLKKGRTNFLRVFPSCQVGLIINT